MPVGWFLIPYVRDDFVGGSRIRPGRRLPIDDLTPTIWADNGFPQGNVPGSPEFWTEAEVLGQHAIVKVRANVATLQSINAIAGVLRIPVASLDDPLSSLTAPQRNALRDKVLSLGYTLAELQARFPNDLRTYTLRAVLTFIARRRRKVRYDEQSDTIVDDGPEQQVRPIDEVDGAVV
jgi:hypothetical protein